MFVENGPLCRKRQQSKLCVYGVTWIQLKVGSVERVQYVFQSVKYDFLEGGLEIYGEV